MLEHIVQEEHLQQVVLRVQKEVIVQQVRVDVQHVNQVEQQEQMEQQVELDQQVVIQVVERVMCQVGRQLHGAQTQ